MALTIKKTNFAYAFCTNLYSEPSTALKCPLYILYSFYSTVCTVNFYFFFNWIKKPEKT